MRKKVAIPIRDKSNNEEDVILVINPLNQFKHACHSSNIHENAAIWSLKDCMTGPTFAAIMLQLIMSPDNSNKHGGMIMAHLGAVSHLVIQEPTDAVRR